MTDSSDENFVYPLQDGARWEYEGEYAITKVDGDSVVLDTVYDVSGSVEILRHLNLQEFEKVYEIRDILRGRNGPRESTSYYKNRDDGLYLLGYSAGGVGDYFPKRTTRGRYLLNGTRFSSIDDMMAMFHFASIHTFGYQDDSLYFEQPPVKAIAYPLEVNRRWIYRESGRPWRIEKEVTGRRTLSVPAGEYDAYRIRWWYDIDDDGNWDDNISIVDFVAQIGLIKRTISIHGIEEVAPGGENLLEILESNQEYRLTALDT